MTTAAISKPASRARRAPVRAIRVEDVLVPTKAAGSLREFRRWALSPDFPASGRIDYLHGVIEVDMIGEELYGHGALKSRLHGFIEHIVSEQDLGQIYVDRARLSSQRADLSCEPDILFVSWESLESGRARYVTTSKELPARSHEIEGAVDLVVEVVSKSSLLKDMRQLPALYAKARVRDYWLASALEPELSFQIFHLHRGRCRKAEVDAEGFQVSPVLGRRLRLRREPARLPGTWRYLVDEAPIPG